MSLACGLELVIIWQVFVAAAAAVAGTMRLEAISEEKARRKAWEKEQIKEVEWVEEKSPVLKESLRGDEGLILQKKDLKVQFRVDPRGRLKIAVTGKGSEEELREQGKALFHRIAQEYAYRRVKEVAQKQGLQVGKEEKLEDGTIVLRLYTWV